MSNYPLLRYGYDFPPKTNITFKTLCTYFANHTKTCHEAYYASRKVLASDYTLTDGFDINSPTFGSDAEFQEGAVQRYCAALIAEAYVRDCRLGRRACGEIARMVLARREQWVDPDFVESIDLNDWIEDGGQTRDDGIKQGGKIDQNRNLGISVTSTSLLNYGVKFLSSCASWSVSVVEFLWLSSLFRSSFRSALVICIIGCALWYAFSMGVPMLLGKIPYIGFIAKWLFQRGLNGDHTPKVEVSALGDFFQEAWMWISSSFGQKNDTITIYDAVTEKLSPGNIFSANNTGVLSELSISLSPLASIAYYSCLHIHNITGFIAGSTIEDKVAMGMEYEDLHASSKELSAILTEYDKRMQVFIKETDTRLIIALIKIHARIASPVKPRHTAIYLTQFLSLIMPPACLFLTKSRACVYLVIATVQSFCLSNDIRYPSEKTWCKPILWTGIDLSSTSEIIMEEDALNEYIRQELDSYTSTVNEHINRYLSPIAKKADDQVDMVASHWKEVNTLRFKHKNAVSSRVKGLANIANRNPGWIAYIFGYRKGLTVAQERELAGLNDEVRDNKELDSAHQMAELAFGTSEKLLYQMKGEIAEISVSYEKNAMLMAGAVRWEDVVHHALTDLAVIVHKLRKTGRYHIPNGHERSWMEGETWCKEHEESNWILCMLEGRGSTRSSDE